MSRNATMAFYCIHMAILCCCAVDMHAQAFVDQSYKITSFKDVQYATAARFDGRTDTLRMSIVVPTNDNATKRPLVIWIHGGGFIQGNRADFQALAESWARRGYTAVTISYRLGIHGGLFDPPFAFDEAELTPHTFSSSKMNASDTITGVINSVAVVSRSKTTCRI